MPPIGETLREARMRQRLDIADVEERTKIRAKYLRALENEEWGLLPGPTFVRTFLRTYAEVVGLDPHPIVEEYRMTQEGAEGPELQPLAPLPRREGRRAGRRPPPRAPRRGGLLVAGAVAALLAFLVVLGLLGGGEDPEERGDRPAATGPTSDGAPGDQGQRRREARRQARQQRRQRERRRAAASGVRVRVAPLEATYLCVDAGPGTDVVFEGTLDAARTFRDRERVRINLGKRSAALTLNGEAVAVADSADPLALELTRDGADEIAATEAPCT